MNRSRLSFAVSAARDEVQLVLIDAHGAQLAIPVVENLRARTSTRALERGCEVEAVEHAVVRYFRTGKRRGRRQQIEARAEIGDGAGANRAGPRDDRGRSDAALPGCPLSSSQRARGTAMLMKRQPRAVIAREQEQRIALDASGAQRVDDRADAPVD